MLSRIARLVEGLARFLAPRKGLSRRFVHIRTSWRRTGTKDASVGPFTVAQIGKMRWILELADGVLADVPARVHE